jgi:hypothetical protein
LFQCTMHQWIIAQIPSCHPNVQLALRKMSSVMAYFIHEKPFKFIAPKCYRNEFLLSNLCSGKNLMWPCCRCAGMALRRLLSLDNRERKQTNTRDLAMNHPGVAGIGNLHGKHGR